MSKPIEQLLEPKDSGYILYRGDTIPYKSNIQVMYYKQFLQ